MIFLINVLNVFALALQDNVSLVDDSMLYDIAMYTYNL